MIHVVGYKSSNTHRRIHPIVHTPSYTPHRIEEKAQTNETVIFPGAGLRVEANFLFDPITSVVANEEEATGSVTLQGSRGTVHPAAAATSTS